MARNIVVQLNKFCFKDGKGDPRGFVTFLDDNNLPRGLIPRYRGNRLHLLFNICAILTHHYDTHSTICGDLQAAILSDFNTAVAKDEMYVHVLCKSSCSRNATSIWTSLSN